MRAINYNLKDKGQISFSVGEINHTKDAVPPTPLSFGVTACSNLTF